MVRRIYVEKKEPFAVKAKELHEEIRNYLGLKNITRPLICFMRRISTGQTIRRFSLLNIFRDSLIREPIRQSSASAS